MMDRPAVRIIIEHVRILGLLVRYVYLHIRYVQLHIQYYLLKAAGAAILEAAKIELCIKSLSKEDRVIFAACVSISIYFLTLTLLVRM